MNRLIFLLRFASLMLCAALLTPSSRAATLNVPAQYTTIQAAVTAANTGDTILVADGIFTGAGNRNIDFGGKDLTAQSTSGNPATCIIDCQNQGRAFYLRSGETAKSGIAGFTIKNGFGSSDSGNGGGIYIGSNNPTVTNCVFIGNSAANYGGGLRGGAATSCVFVGNTANGNSGGGMAGGAATKCVFTRNSAYGSIGSGGGLYSGVATNCAFNGNTAYSGGGIGSGTATNCVFTGNSASAGGGGMDGGAANSCVFTRNSAYGGGGMGGGAANSCVFVSNSAVYGGGALGGTVTNCAFLGNSAAQGGGAYGNIATNCIFTGNTASGNGGGMSNGTAINGAFTGNTAGGNGGGADEADLSSCTLTGNSATGEGGGAYLSSNAAINCIVWGNAAGMSGSNIEVFPGGGTITYSDVQGGFTGTGNINADPQFVNQSTGNLHLTAGSPCIDRGTTTVPPGLIILTFPAADRDGGKRTIGNGPDMGAYEYGNVGIYGMLVFDGISALAPAQNVTFQFRPVGGGAAINATYLTTADGGFYLYGVPDGSYNLWVKSPAYLSALVPVTAAGGIASIAATLEPGDANNDNRCDTTDFGILIGSYGNSDKTIPGSAATILTADFNGDGSA